MITQQRLKELLSFDPETGQFTWRVQRRGTVRLDSVNGCPVGCRMPSGRLVITLDGKTYTAARLAWLYTYGELPEGNLRVLNDDPADVRPVNLATASSTPSEPKKRAPRASSSQSPYVYDESGNARVRGVSYEPGKGKWVARVTLKKARTFLGRFDTKQEAEAAVLKAFARP